MLKYTLIIVCLTFGIVNARPTFDVLYKIAQDIENGLTDTVAEPHRHPSGYGQHPPRPAGGYYTEYAHGHVHGHGHGQAPLYPYGPGQYPSPYPVGPYPQQVGHGHGHPAGPLYPGSIPPYAQYPPNNYLHGPPNPYDVNNYLDQYGNNAYGHESGSNSYVFAHKSGQGYKNMGY